MCSHRKLNHRVGRNISIETISRIRNIVTNASNTEQIMNVTSMKSDGLQVSNINTLILVDR